MISIYNNFKSDLDNLKIVYRNYKDEKMNYCKYEFILKLRKRVNYKFKYNLAREYYIEKAVKTSFSILHKSYLKILLRNYNV